MISRTTDKGFAVIKAVLVVVLILLVGFLTWYIWHSSNQTAATLDSASKSASSNPKAHSNAANTTSSSQQYFTIKEWNVKAPYSNTLSLEYSLKPASSSSPAMADFNSKQLEATASACNSGGAGGKIYRYKGTDEFLNEDGSDSGKTAAQEAEVLDHSLWGNVGNYYYFFVHAQSTCEDSQQSTALQSQTNDAVKSLVQQLQSE